MKKINLIQDIPTIHNNKIICKIAEQFQVKEYYALFYDKERYNHEKPINNVDSIEYGNKLNLKFIYDVLINRDITILVGVMNINTKVIFLLSFICFKKIIYWTDLPKPKESFFGKLKRSITIYVLKLSNFTIWAVGNITEDYFIKYGVAKERIKNVPILVDCYQHPEHKIKTSKDKILIFSGSRLIHEKGFDILINAISLLPKNIKDRIKVIISGDGEEFQNLNNLIHQNNLIKVVQLTGWLDEKTFLKYLKNSDIVIQPSRYDAFGLSIYGMANCAAVIASNKSGAALERITNKKNGFIYKYDDVNKLCAIISHLVDNDAIRIEAAKLGHKTAKKWTPDYILEVLEND
jgi:glycosyltransferase involved in cell wall biosynthesis